MSKKFLWVIERKDSMGEFQPMPTQVFLDNATAINRVETMHAAAGPANRGRLRVVRYRRHVPRDGD